jgi:hypothetical protein
MPTMGTQDVSELQEPTYSPIDEQLLTAVSTHTLSPKPKLAYQHQREYTPEQLVVVEKILEAFPEAPEMVEVARCESDLNPLADRANLNVDVGLFQLNQVHLAELNRLGLDRRNIDDNITYARLLYDQAGTQPWYMSQYCWG